MVWLSGFLLSQKLRYVTTFWTVNATAQVAIIANLSYDFGKALRLFVGVSGLPGTRSLQGTSPYFFGTDCQLADEFFRPGFTSGLWITGEPIPRVIYNAMVGNNLSQLGITSAQLTRNFGDRRERVVVADDRRVRSARLLRRLRGAREGRHAVRHVVHAQPRGSLRPGHDRGAGQHADSTVRQPIAVRARRARERPHGREGGLLAGRGRHRPQIQRPPSPGRVLRALAQQLQHRRAGSRERDLRSGFLRPGRVLRLAEAPRAVRIEFVHLRAFCNSGRSPAERTSTHSARGRFASTRS